MRTHIYNISRTDCDSFGFDGIEHLPKEYATKKGSVEGAVWVVFDY